MKLKREGDTQSSVLSPITWPSTKIADGTEELVTTDSVDGCCVMP